MMDIFIEMISYPFMVRAIIVGCLVSLCASLLGTSLVLKRYSMIGDGLSHVGFAALAIAYAFHAEPLTISIPACIAAAFFLLQLKDSAKIKGDSATAQNDALPSVITQNGGRKRIFILFFCIIPPSQYPPSGFAGHLLINKEAYPIPILPFRIPFLNTAANPLLTL